MQEFVFLHCKKKSADDTNVTDVSPKPRLVSVDSCSSTEDFCHTCYLEYKPGELMRNCGFLWFFLMQEMQNVKDFCCHSVEMNKHLLFDHLLSYDFC